MNWNFKYHSPIFFFITNILFQSKSFFTDDSILTCAVADSILHNLDFAKTLQKYGREYPNGGYGGMFIEWIYSNNPKPYNSWGNGSAMRVSPIGFAYESLKKTLDMAKKSSEITHSHPEGIKGAQATAAAIYLARNGKSKDEIKIYIEKQFHYDLTTTIEEIRPKYSFDVSCQGTVPPAIRAFLESSDFEDAIRTTISLGGDADTLGAITGGIAEAFYGGVPEEIKIEVLNRLDENLKKIIQKFFKKYNI